MQTVRLCADGNCLTCFLICIAEHQLFGMTAPLILFIRELHAFAVIPAASGRDKILQIDARIREMVNIIRCLYCLGCQIQDSTVLPGDFQRPRVLSRIRCNACDCAAGSKDRRSQSDPHDFSHFLCFHFIFLQIPHRFMRLLKGFHGVLKLVDPVIRINRSLRSSFELFFDCSALLLRPADALNSLLILLLLHIVPPFRFLEGITLPVHL